MVDELVESWINGNLEFVIEECQVLPVYIAVLVGYSLSQRSQNDFQLFVKMLKS